MSKSFKGRAILPGNVEGEALVSRAGFNSLASFYTSMVTGAEAATVFDDPLALAIPDLSHSWVSEPRWITIGRSSRGVLLVVVATHTADRPSLETIRLISSRVATPRERKVYTEGQDEYE